MTDAELLELRTKQLSTCTRVMREVAEVLRKDGDWLPGFGNVHRGQLLQEQACKLENARAGTYLAVAKLENTLIAENWALKAERGELRRALDAIQEVLRGLL